MKEINEIINKHRKAKDLAVAMNIMFWFVAAMWVFNVVRMVINPFGLEPITSLGFIVVSLNLILTGALYLLNAPYRQVYGFFGQRTYTSLSAIPPWPTVWLTQPLRKLTSHEYSTLRFEFEDQPALMETLNCGNLTVKDALTLHIHNFVYYGPAKIGNHEMKDQRPVVNQIELISAITSELKKQNPDISIDLPLYNVIISAANLVRDESVRERVYATEPMTRQEWLASDDTGMSSKFLCGVVTGPEEVLHLDGPLPSDIADLGRCVRMVRVLGGHQHLHRLSQCEHGWVRIYEHWSTLEAWYDNDNGKAVYNFLHSADE